MPDQETERPPRASGAPKLGHTFGLLYPLAFLGSFVTFVPLLSVLLPLKAAALSPADRVAVLSHSLLAGALVASVGNLLVGTASDLTYRRVRTRRPWILIGLLLLAIGYACFGAALRFPELLGALVILQISFNMILAPLGAVLGDHVEDARKGRVSALLNLAPPIATGVAALTALPFFYGATSRLMILLLLGIGLMAPFLFSKEYRSARGGSGERSRPAVQTEAIQTAVGWDFSWFFMSRLMVQVGFWLSVTYILFFLQDQVRSDARPAAATALAQTRFALLTGSSALFATLASLFAGIWSDACGRRRPFVVAGGVAMVGGALGLASAVEWGLVPVTYVALQMGHSCFVTVDMAAAMEILKGSASRGRLLGILNLTNTLPSIVAPALGVALLRQPDGYVWLFVSAAAFMGAGTLAFLPIRSVR